MTTSPVGWAASQLQLPPLGSSALSMVATLVPGDETSLAGLDELAATVLAPAERAAWAGLPPYRRRREQWLLGRLAAKCAVQKIVAAEAGEQEPLAVSDIAVVADSSGAPRVTLPRRWQAVRPTVSISHTGSGSDGSVGVALATVDPRVRGVGVDVELYRPRRSLEVKGLTDVERALLHPLGAVERLELTLRLWTAKEAAVKSLGLDLDQVGGPRSVDVTLVSSDASELRVDVATPGRPPLTRRVTAHTRRDANLMIAVALDADSEPPTA